MKFAELRPEFRHAYGEVPTIENTQGVEHDCPQCKRDGLEHRIWVPFARWKIKQPGSTSVDNITYEPSVRVTSGQCFGHWNITNGEVIFHGDSHAAVGYGG
jgi:ribosomal protein L37AE/L43A